MHVDELRLRDADRSPGIQSAVAKHGGAGYEGGHLLARMFGGSPEYHNIVAMLKSVNRGAGDSFGNMERHWQSLLEKDPSARISVDIRRHYSGVSKIPDEIEVRSVVNGHANRKYFFND